MSQLIEHGTVRRGLLGVTVQPVTSDIARSLNVEAHGALVNSLTAGGAAEKAGMQRGDIITAINGAPVNDSNSLRNEVGADAARLRGQGDAPARGQGADRQRPARREAGRTR